MYKAPARWEWAFEHNPFLAGGAPPVWIAVDDDTGEVVGQSAAWPERLQVGDAVHSASWGADFFVLPAYRHLGIGPRIQKMKVEAHDLFMSLSMAQDSRRINEWLGMRPFPPVYLYRCLEVPSLPAVPAGWNLEVVDCFPASVDNLWRDLAPRSGLAIRRDAAFLNWKFRDQPLADHDRYLLYRRGTLCGYSVLRVTRPPESPMVVLVDMMVDDTDAAALDAALRFTFDRARARAITEVRGAASAPMYRAAYERNGLAPIAQTTPMIGCRPGTSAASAIEGARQWFLSKGDHDWDQYPLADRIR